MGAEARARQTLLAMFERISLDPRAALGLAGNPDPAQVRAAFLAATKQFHPARFARMSPDVQKLANEVFLALRAAHDTLARAPVKPRSTGPIPVVSPVRSTGPPPAVRATSSQVMRAHAGAPRTPTGTHEASQPLRPIGGPSTTPRATTAPVVASSSRTAVGVGTRTDARRGAPVRRSGVYAVTAPSSAGPAPAKVASAGAAHSAPGDRELQPILALLAQHQFAAARAALEVLAAGAPHTTRYRALIAYASGREAQLAHRLDEARVELMDALQLDPELQLAKQALAELFTRRK